MPLLYFQDCQPAGGTRFIGVYLARQLIEEGHDVTLLTRGKAEVKFQIPDDTDASYKNYEDSVKHIACDRKDAEAVKQKVSSGGFDGRVLLNRLWCAHMVQGYFRFIGGSHKCAYLKQILPQAVLQEQRETLAASLLPYIVRNSDSTCGLGQAARCS